MQLSIRMQAVADMVTPGGKVADVGTDHGYVPIYLIEQNKAFHAIAMDVRKGPLARAGVTISATACIRIDNCIYFLRLLIQITFKARRFAGLAQLAQRFSLNLSDTFTSNIEFLTHFLKGMLMAVIQAKTHPENLLFTLI